MTGPTDLNMSISSFGVFFLVCVQYDNDRRHAAPRHPLK
jgi:hypothetical protein